MQDVARRRIRHHGHVPVPAPERGLVHRKAPDRFHLAARKSTRHRTLHDSVHRVPAQPHPLGDRLDARRLEPPDHLRLELRRVPRAPLRPRHLDRHHPVFRALHPRDVADQKGLVAPGVQVPPLAPPSIVARARPAAVRTPQPASPGPLQLHPKFLRLPGRLHPRDLPLRTQAQNGVQPVPPGHVCEFLSVSLWDSCRGRALRGLTMQSLPSPSVPKGSLLLSSRSAAVPVTSVSRQAVVRGVAERVTSSRRQHARLQGLSVRPSTCFLDPCLPHPAIARARQSALCFDFSCAPPTTTGEEPVFIPEIRSPNVCRAPTAMLRGRLQRIKERACPGWAPCPG